MAKKAPID